MSIVLLLCRLKLTTAEDLHLVTQHQQPQWMAVSVIVMSLLSLPSLSLLSSPSLTFPPPPPPVPERLPAPGVTPLNGTAILIEWVEPEMPNGFIVEYIIFL